MLPRGEAAAGTRENESQTRVEASREDLRSFYDALPEDFKRERRLQPLTDRVQRGVNPISLMGLRETAGPVAELEQAWGVDRQKLLDVSAVLQSGGPWDYADEFRSGKDPAVRLWLTLAGVSNMVRKRELDLTPDEFVGDLEKAERLLKSAVADPEAFYVRARESVVDGLEEAKQKRLYVVEDGVPISELDDGFTYMAIEGHRSGVWIDADGMLFVGAKEIDGGSITKWGLKAESAQDERGRTVTFYANEQGERLIKQLYPGFAVILNRSFELAKAVSRAAAGTEEPAPSGDALGHAMFEPTSAAEAGDDEFQGLEFLRHMRDHRPGPESKSTAMIRVKDLFYDQLRYVKSTVKSMDAVEAAEKMKAQSGKTLKEKDKEKIVMKEWRKMDQKADELIHLIDAMKEDLSGLPASEQTVVMDMAGGAGDLGLAVSMQMLAEGRGLKETRIVDPFAKKMGLDHFMGLIIDASPFRSELKEKVRQTNEPLQEAEITPDALVVAKHACGTLSDDILEKWVRSESPMVCLMTCCQEKAADYSPRYGFSRAEWKMLCKDSGGTAALNPRELDDFIAQVAKSGGLDPAAAEKAVLRAANSEPFRPQVWDGLWESLSRDRALTPEAEEGLRAELGRGLGLGDQEWSDFIANFRKDLVNLKGLLEGDPADKAKDGQLKARAEGKLKARVWKFWFGKHFQDQEGLKLDLADNTATYLRGLQAMTVLDGRRVEYLRRHGFEAELKQTTKFPKGDIIIARRRQAASGPGDQTS